MGLGIKENKGYQLVDALYKNNIINKKILGLVLNEKANLINIHTLICHQKKIKTQTIFILKVE